MRVFRPITAFALGLLTAGFLCLGCTSAHALPISFEFGGSLATVTTPGPLYQALGKTSSNSGTSLFAVPATFSLHLQNSQRGVLFALALQERYLSGKTGTNEDFAVLTLTPMLRIEYWMFVFGAGYSPFAFSDLMLTRAKAISSTMTLEAQMLFPITPEIDFGLSLARQTFQTDFGDGPDPTIQYGLFFRLNFGMSDADRDARRRFKGWRYPLGISKI